MKKKAYCHRRWGRNNREKLRDKNGNGRENVAACMWKDVATSDEVARGNEKREIGNMKEGTGNCRRGWVKPKGRRGTEGKPRKMTTGVNRAK